MEGGTSGRSTELCCSAWRIYAAVVLGLAAVFGIGSFVPLEINPDLGFHVRAVETWLLGWSGFPLELALPDVNDLSRDQSVWITWWPPGAALLFLLQMIVGWTPSTALRLGAFVCACMGGIGWVKLAKYTGCGRVTRAVVASLAVAHGAFGGGATTVMGADILGYAVMPWIMLNALGIVRGMSQQWSASRLILRCCLLGFEVGLLFWLKYSAFLAGGGVLGFLLFALSRPRDPRSVACRVGAGMAAVFASVVLVAGLLALNAARGAAASTIGEAERSGGFGGGRLRPADLVIEVAGAPGVALFGASGWMNHFLHFSDVFERERDVDPMSDSGPVKGVLGLLGSTVFVWSLWRPRGGVSLPARQLVGFSYFSFLGGGIVASLALGYDLLAHEASRLSIVVLPIMQAVVVDQGVASWRRAATALQRSGVLLLAALLLAGPLAFALTAFVHLDLRERLRRTSDECAGELWLPELNAKDSFCLWRELERVLPPGQPGVVVLATNEGTSIRGSVGRSMRVLPMGNFFGPLVGGPGEAVRASSGVPLQTERPIRVVVVARKAQVEAKLKGRLAQATSWRSEHTPAGAPRIVWTDLEVNESPVSGDSADPDSRHSNR